MRRCTRAVLLGATMTLTAVLGGAVGPVAPARADPSPGQVQQRAAALRHQLDLLSTQQGLAVEQYDAAAEALQQATIAQVQATAALADARLASSDSDDVGTRRARALYMSGGPLGLTATVLDSTSLVDALSRWQAVETIVRGDATTTADRSADLAAARTSAADVERSRALTAARQLAADRAVTAVQASLAEQARLLADADAEVVAVADQQRRAAEATALAQAQVSAARLGIAVTASTRTQGPAGGPAQTRPPDVRLPDAPAPTAAADRAIAAARTRLGLPYVWGATGPDSFDCSGLTGWAYRQAGIAIPRTSRQQFAALPRVALDQLQPGDLVFYATDTSDPGTIHHVGLYVGAGLSLYAPQTGSVVKIGAVGYGRIIGAVRPAPAA